MKYIVVILVIAVSGSLAGRIRLDRQNPVLQSAIPPVQNINPAPVPYVVPEVKSLPINNLGKPVSEFEKKQAESARYAFSTDIDDHISDLTHSRTEVRDGLNVMGSYSYSDGYIKHTVRYVADDNGYRIVGMENEPLPGPMIDLTGVASVDSAQHGRHIMYRVQSVPIPGPVSKIANEVL